jgi:hypothetical protein
MTTVHRELRTGGGSGIRTHVRVSPKHAFQACALSHSAIPPSKKGATLAGLSARAKKAPRLELGRLRAAWISGCEAPRRWCQIGCRSAPGALGVTRPPRAISQGNIGGEKAAGIGREAVLGMGWARNLGWLLILAALLVAAYEAYGWHAHGTYRITAASELWQRLSPASLDWTQAAIERHISPAAWDDAFGPLLREPTWAVLGVPGLLLAFLFRRRHRGRSARRFS